MGLKDIVKGAGKALLVGGAMYGTFQAIDMMRFYDSIRLMDNKSEITRSEIVQRNDDLSTIFESQSPIEKVRYLGRNLAIKQYDANLEAERIYLGGKE